MAKWIDSRGSRIKSPKIKFWPKFGRASCISYYPTRLIAMDEAAAATAAKLRIYTQYSSYIANSLWARAKTGLFLSLAFLE